MLSLYVHLNPVMRKAHGLGKAAKRAESLGMSDPDSATVSKRISDLRQYPWSSYRAYASYEKVPQWLTTGDILCRVARNKSERVARYRAVVGQRLSKGVELGIKERLTDGFALGSEAFRERIRLAAKDGREVSGSDKLRAAISFDQLAGLVEDLRGEGRDVFMVRWGDWGRPLLLWAARRYTGMTLQQIGEAAGSMDYTAVAMAVKRFKQKAAANPEYQSKIDAIKRRCEMWDLLKKSCPARTGQSPSLQNLEKRAYLHWRDDLRVVRSDFFSRTKCEDVTLLRFEDVTLLRF